MGYNSSLSFSLFAFESYRNSLNIRFEEIHVCDQIVSLILTNHDSEFIIGVRVRIQEI